MRRRPRADESAPPALGARCPWHALRRMRAKAAAGACGRGGHAAVARTRAPSGCAERSPGGGRAHAQATRGPLARNSRAWPKAAAQALEAAEAPPGHRVARGPGRRTERRPRAVPRGSCSTCRARPHVEATAGTVPKPARGHQQAALPPALRVSSAQHWERTRRPSPAHEQQRARAGGRSC